MQSLLTYLIVGIAIAITGRHFWKVWKGTNSASDSLADCEDSACATCTLAATCKKKPTESPSEASKKR